MKKRNLGRVLSVCISLMVCIMSLCEHAYAAKIVELNSTSVFLKQETGRTCTLSATLMMFRRGALINGDENWNSFTEGNYRSKWWGNGGMVWYPKSGDMSGATYSIAKDLKISTDLAARKKYFIKELERHREGIVIYYYYNSNNCHAILLTDYDAKTDTFYCADPANNVAQGRIALSKSSLYKYISRTGRADASLSKQENIISQVTQIWRINSGINYCSHPQYAFGECTKCHQPYPGLDSKDYSVAGIYRATEPTVYMKSMPYSDKTNKTSKTRGDGIGKGTELRVLYAVKNQYQNIWYYAETYGGTAGYVYSGDVAYVRKLPVTIQFSNNITQPQSFTQRASYTQNLTSGAVTAKDGNIRSVQAFFFPASGSVSDKSCWDRERTDVIPVGKASYNINSSSKINLQLTFGNLKAGTYQYGIEAIDSNGEAWYWASRTFTVSPVSQPTVKNCDLRFGQAVAVDGGIRATISSSTPGAKVTVTPAERIIQNSGSSVTVELRYSQTVSASASASGYQTVRGSQTYNVGSCAEPDFYLNETPEGTTVTLTCSTGGASIYYSLDGVTFSPYASPLTLTSTQTVYAYAQKAGCTTSETREQLVSVTAPAAPVLTAGGLGSDVPVGTVLAVSWPEIRNAADYEVTVSVNGVETTQTVTQPQASVTADAAGIYEFQVRARNAAGFGDSSQLLRITAHEPSTVRFVNYDGALLTEQSVPWGGAATAPSVPQRRGYTFAGWDRSFRQVTGDLTVTAQYEIKTYTVRFFDYDGETMVHTQKIRFGSGIDSASACAYLSEKEGFVFTGWRVVSADAESQMDVECVDSDFSLVAVRQWEKADLPVIISGVSALRNENATAYEVQYDITTAPRAQLGGDTVGVKVIAVLKSEQTGEDGEPVRKVLALAVDSVALGEDEQHLTGKSITIALGNRGEYTRADVVELYALALDGADRTGGALSEVASAVPKITVSWSGWSDTAPEGVAEDSIRTRTVYRYRDNSKQTMFTTSCKVPFTQMSGWTYEDSTSYWGSSFTSDSQLETNDAVQLVKEETVVVSQAYTQYRYGRWTNGTNNSYCPTSGKKNYGGSWRIENSAWSTSRYQVCGKDFYCSNKSHNHRYVAYTDNYGHNWHPYSSNGVYSKAGRWFWEESRTVAAVTRPRYTYQYKYYTNNFYKWVEGNWSEWSAEPVTAVADSRDVETKLQYSYITNDITQLPDDSGRAYTVTGALPLSGDLEGKLATVMVYKTRNTDPTESQLEYVDQVTLDHNGAFALTLKNKEDPSEYTGDYTVTLAVQGGGNLINVAQIRYDADYTVVFSDGEGTELSRQTVSRGKDAEAPQPPEKKGYRFVKWDSRLTDVQSNLEVIPVWMPETWSVVFVDHVNQTVELKTGLETGSVLSFPQTAEAEGYTFNGWQVRRGDSSTLETDGAITVDANLIAVADWTRQTYTVTFVDAGGNTVSTQNVPYGASAVPPESIPVEEGKVFVGWSGSTSWWAVTGDLCVSPIVAYQATTAAPASNIDGYASGTSQLLILTAEDGAKIYYTLDGSDPTLPEGSGDQFGSKDGNLYEYTDPIEMTEDTTVKVIAVADGKNESEIIEIDFVYQETAEAELPGQVIGLKTVNVIAQPSKTVTLQVDLQNNPGLLSYQFVLQADPAVFGVPCDENGEMLLAQALNGGGSLFAAPYDPELGGWLVFWYSTETYRDNGPLLTLTLKTLDGAETGTYPVTLGFIAENTVTEEDVLAELDTGSLLLSMSGGTLLGDVSGDGKVTAVDVIRIAKYVLDDATFSASQLAAADVTGDGKVTAADVIRLARYLVGLAELGSV